MDLQELYQEIIVDHSKSPRNHGTLEGANHHADGDNPLCGDQITVHLDVVDGVVRDARFEGKGCAISTATASLFTEAVKGKSRDEVETLCANYLGMVKDSDAIPDVDTLGQLAALHGVSRFPMRVKCATLAPHTLLAAMRGDATASTETEDAR